jgi:hypothetical protein
MLWAVVLVAAVVLSACGGGDDDDDDPTPTATQGATVAAPTTASGGADTANTSPTAEATFDFAAMEETANAQSTMVAEFKGEIDACDLVSRKDAEEIMGVKLSGDPFPGVPGFTDSRSFCNYNPESVPGTAIIPDESVQLIALKEEDIKALGMGDDIDTFWDEGKASSQDDEGFVEIDDVGDEAHFTPDGGMVARKGDTLIGVSGLDQEKSTKFLKKAIDNL